MQQRQSELNAQGWGTDEVSVLGVGIGLNTGTVIAGAIGGTLLTLVVLGLGANAGWGDRLVRDALQRNPQILVETADALDCDLHVDLRSPSAGTLDAAAAEIERICSAHAVPRFRITTRSYRR